MTSYMQFSYSHTDALRLIESVLSALCLRKKVEVNSLDIGQDKDDTD